MRPDLEKIQMLADTSLDNVLEVFLWDGSRIRSKENKEITCYLSFPQQMNSAINC